MQHRKLIWDYVLFCLFLSKAYTDVADKKERIRHLNMDRKERIAFLFYVLMKKTMEKTILQFEQLIYL